MSTVHIPDFFDYLDSAQDADLPALRLSRARSALREALRDGGLSPNDPQIRWLRALLRFADFDRLAAWVEQRPRTLRRIASWALREGHDEVASMIDQALARGTGLSAAEADYSDLEAHLGLVLDGFTGSVLETLRASRGRFPLPLPRVLRRRIPEVG